jgi:tetratricopeptide (TPR) repeat protein
MAVQPLETQQLRSQLQGLIQAWQGLKEAPPGDTEAEDRKRETLGQLNGLFWNHLFQRLENVVAACADRRLSFSPDDHILFDFGLAGDDAEASLPDGQDKPYHDGEFTVMSLTEWLAHQDDRFMELPRRGRLAEQIRKAASTIDDVNRQVAELQARREGLVRASRDAQTVLDGLNDHESAHLSIYLYEKARKKRSLTGGEAKTYAQNRLVVMKPLSALCKGLGPQAEREVPQLTQEIILLRKRLADLREELEGIERERDTVETRCRNVGVERRLQLESWLREVKENTELCSKFGRCLYTPLLLDGKPVVKRAEIVETIKYVESWDPQLFRNRRVEKEGIPKILMTPGSGNGSYDYRTNTIVIPVATPSTLLEAVAYALALYRRDIDKTENEGKLWESFFDEDVWRKAEMKRPSGIRDRMNVFVSRYCLWILKETSGFSVLEPAIREWFELSVAPDRRRPILPRELRRVRVDDIENRRRAYLAQGDAHALYCHAVLSFRVEDYDAALDSTEKSVRMNAEFADVHWLFGLLMTLDEQTLRETRAEGLRKLGLLERRKRAKTCFQTYLKLAPQSWWSQKAQQYIREIESDLALRK